MKPVCRRCSGNGKASCADKMQTYICPYGKGGDFGVIDRGYGLC